MPVHQNITTGRGRGSVLASGENCYVVAEAREQFVVSDNIYIWQGLVQSVEIMLRWSVARKLLRVAGEYYAAGFDDGKFDAAALFHLLAQLVAELGNGLKMIFGAGNGSGKLWAPDVGLVLFVIRQERRKRVFDFQEIEVAIGGDQEEIRIGSADDAQISFRDELNIAALDGENILP